MINKLSVAERSLPTMTPNPWLRLAEDWPDVMVEYVHLGARWAETVWHDGHPRIRMNDKLTQVQRRSAIAHECEHLERGRPCGSLRTYIERQVINATAVYLLPSIDAIAEALAVYDLSNAANSLWVPKKILVDRMNGFTDQESRYVHARRLELED